MNTEQIIQMIKSGQTNLYVRWSSGPESDRGGCSRDHAAGESHAAYTISANPLVRQDRIQKVDELGFPMGVDWVPDVAFCRNFGLRKWVEMQCSEYSFLPGRPWIMRAERVGTDSDGAALVDSRTFEFVGYWEEK
jgi:hypothetical protein